MTEDPKIYIHRLETAMNATLLRLQAQEFATLQLIARHTSADLGELLSEHERITHVEIDRMLISIEDTNPELAAKISEANQNLHQHRLSENPPGGDSSDE